VAGGDWCVDADTMEHLDVIRAVYVYTLFKYC
jgi:hypothetical protein